MSTVSEARQHATPEPIGADLHGLFRSPPFFVSGGEVCGVADVPKRTANSLLLLCLARLAVSTAKLEMTPGEFEEISAKFDFGQIDSDVELRAAAFAEVRRLMQRGGTLTSGDLAQGFTFQGERIPFVNPQRGIFKPRQMQRLLSIRTVFPRAGRRVWYDDQHKVLQQFQKGDETVDYAFMGDSPDAADNRWLHDAMLQRTPIIYFLGIAPSAYQALLPTFVTDFDRVALKVRLAFGDPDELGTVPTTASERRYSMRQVRQRLHQCSFREAVIWAYSGRCAFSGLPEPRLLDAAHIVEDKHEMLGQPVIQNGIALSKTYHAAFDANLIGIDPDYRIHVSSQLLSRRDGATFEAMKRLDGQSLLRTRRKEDLPDPERLEMRFRAFAGAE
jgi:putative restriction endonuclease